MTDLTFCHLHMTNRDMLIFETFENPLTYLSGELSDEELEIPPHMVPPNPDDADILPSQVHPSYPYGNPTNLRHPAARPRKPQDFSSRALFDDMTYAGGGVNGALRWKDLALDMLLPVDREKEEAAKAALARKMASGTSSSNYPAPQQPEEDAADGQLENGQLENGQLQDGQLQDGLLQHGQLQDGLSQDSRLQLEESEDGEDENVDSESDFDLDSGEMGDEVGDDTNENSEFFETSYDDD